MKEGREEDNRRYREFLKYCEERREERKQKQEEDHRRKVKAKKKEEHWQLLRVCIKPIKQNEIKWTTRKNAECERITEEEKNDRLAIANEKRKRYGLKRLNKEENMRIKKRTEERL